MITLLTMGQGNVNALKRTVDSVIGVCNEVIFGDVCIFAEDSIRIDEMEKDIWFTRVQMPFNFIFKHGFSVTLNKLASYAKNDIVLYLNVGEIISSSLADIKDTVDKNPCDSYYIDHPSEKHRWWRMYNRHKMEWSGLIHEEIVMIGDGDQVMYHKPIFTFADTEKDLDDPFKSKVFGDTKEIVYWRQLMRIADDPLLLDATNPGWRVFAEEQYESMKERLDAKGNRVLAFENGNLDMYLDELNTVEFRGEKFETNENIEFQGEGQKKFLL